MPHDIGLGGQQHLVGVVPGFERIVGRLSAYAVLKVGARRDTADFELRQQAGSDIGPGNAGHFDRQIVVGADEGHEGGPIPLFSGESGHRDRHRRIVERVVARRSARVHIIRVGEADRIETSGRKIHGLRVVRVAQTHHTVIAGREGRQLRGAGRDLAGGNDEIGHAAVHRIENIHLDPADLIAEYLGLPIPQVAQHQFVRIAALAHVLPDTRRSRPCEQQAQSENSESHSPYVFRP